MSQPVAVFITQNFERNLESIQVFFQDNDVPHQFDFLIDSLFGAIIPDLERFPKLGIDFLQRHPDSLEGVKLWETIRENLQGRLEVREYVIGDYLILYALKRDDLYLLSIKHHKQLAFDFANTWIDS